MQQFKPNRYYTVPDALGIYGNKTDTIPDRSKHDGTSQISLPYRTIRVVSCHIPNCMGLHGTSPNKFPNRTNRVDHLLDETTQNHTEQSFISDTKLHRAKLGPTSRSQTSTDSSTCHDLNYDGTLRRRRPNVTENILLPVKMGAGFLKEDKCFLKTNLLNHSFHFMVDRQKHLSANFVGTKFSPAKQGCVRI